MFQRAQQWARTIKRDAVALWLAARDPRVRWYAKAVAAAVAAYALSPIDLACKSAEAQKVPERQTSQVTCT